MNMWSILNIEKTKDAPSIERAFTKTRSSTPSQDAKLLSTACEFALRHAKIRDSLDSFKEEMLLEMAFERYWKLNFPKDSLDQTEAAVSSDITEPRPPQSQYCQEFIKQMQTLYDNFFDRREIANWENLIKQKELWNNNKKELEPYIQDFLLLHRNLPPQAWEIFNEEYLWTDNINEMRASNPAFTRCLLLETFPRWILDYSFVSRGAAFDVENYIKFRRLVREAALENDVDKVKEYFDCAIDIYTNDPGLYEIVADFYSSQPPSYKFGKFGPEYLHALNKLVKLHYDDAKYVLERGDYYTRSEYYDEAREDYDVAMKLDPDNLRIPFAIAESYSMQSQPGSAKSYLKYIKKIYQKTQSNLEKQMSTSKDPDKVSRTIDGNDAIIARVFEKLK